MAFLSNEEKFFFPHKIPSTELIGPGQYIMQTENRKIRQNLAPFGSNVEKLSSYSQKNSKNSNNLNNKKSSSPGPGEYYNDIYINKLKNLKNKEKIINNLNKNRQLKNEELNELKITLEKQNKKKNKNNEKNKKINISEEKEINNFIKDKKKELIGFNIQSKRIYSPKSNTRNYFFKDSPLSNTTYSSKNNNNLNNTFYSKKIYKNNFFINSIPNESKKYVSTIPTKERTYGYEFDENGNLIAKNNPENYKFFSGLKNDTVGPGNYDIFLPWKTQTSLWSKNKENRLIKIKESKSFNENDLNHSFDEIKNFVDNNNNNNKQKLIKDLNLKHKYNIKNKKFPIIFYGHSIENLINKEKKNIPGPGYYYEDEKWSSFKIINKPFKSNKEFNFGSDEDRFNFDIGHMFNKNNNDITNNKLKNQNRLPSPTYYFKDDINRIKNLKKKYKSSQKGNFNESLSKNNNNNFPFNSTVSRFPKLNQNNITYSELYYSPINYIHPSFNKTFKNFGKNSPRFAILNDNSGLYSTNDNPGPGMYINPYSATGFSNTITFNKIITDLETARKNNVVKSQDVVKLKVKEKSPSPWDYNPMTVKSIKFNNIKKTKNVFVNNPPFGTSEPKIDFILKNDEIGPGSYFNNIFDNKKNKKYKNKVPFNFSENRNKFMEGNNEIIGPGKYEVKNQWKKKEFNVLYIN